MSAQTQHTPVLETMAEDAREAWYERERVGGKTQAMQCGEESAKARATVAELIEALRDAVDWISDLRCDDATTHPRLTVLRAALAKAKGAP